MSKKVAEKIQILIEKVSCFVIINILNAIADAILFVDKISNSLYSVLLSNKTLIRISWYNCTVKDATERAGFEPARPWGHQGLLVSKASAIDRSATSPLLQKLSPWRHKKSHAFKLDGLSTRPSVLQTNHPRVLCSRTSARLEIYFNLAGVLYL